MFAAELYPPAQYGWGWLVLALAVVAVGLVAALLGARLTRPRRSLARAVAPPPPPPAFLDPGGLEQLRQEYLVELQLLEAEYRAGRLAPRAAHEELSELVKRFVNEFSGVEAPVLTYSQLAARGVHPALLDAIGRHYYPSLFRRSGIVDPLAGIEAARTVVRVWN